MTSNMTFEVIWGHKRKELSKPVNMITISDSSRISPLVTQQRPYRKIGENPVLVEAVRSFTSLGGLKGHFHNLKNDVAAGFNKYKRVLFILISLKIFKVFFFLFHSIKGGIYDLTNNTVLFKHFLSSKRVLSSNKSCSLSKLSSQNLAALGLIDNLELSFGVLRFCKSKKFKFKAKIQHSCHFLIGT